MHRLSIRPLFLLICCSVFAYCEEPARDTIFYGGPIVTMNAESPMAEAVLVRDGKIEQVGSAKEILALRDARSELIDLQGNTLMPGFISPHTHPDLSAYLYSFVDLSGFTNGSPEEVKEKLKSAIAEASPGQWIFCRGFDPILIPGLKTFTIEELDAMAPQNPVFILAQSMHSAWANSAAFEAAGITAQTPAPAPGSYYEVRNGKLTGLIAEVEALKPFNEAALKAIDIKSNFVGVMDAYSAHGITSIATAGLFAKDNKPIMLLRWLSAENPGFFVRMLGFVGLLPERHGAPRNFVYMKSDTPDLIPEAPDRSDPGFQIIGVKFWYDGSPYTGSMYLSQPYLDSELMQQGLGLKPGTSGSPVLKRDVFRSRLEKYHKAGWQIAIHSQGDQSSREVVDVLEEILKENPRKDHRHRLEHCLLLPPDLMEKIKELGITPSFHINHLYYYGEALRDDIIGPERAAKMLPLKSALDEGIRFTLHADQPMYPEDPLSLVATAVHRQTRNGQTIGEDQAIDIQSALKAVTIDAAWQIGQEKDLGSIEVGKMADFVILDRNPLDPEAALRKIKVQATYRSGRKIYGD